MTVAVSIIVNGKPIEREISASMLLADFLREAAGSNGTAMGCDTAQCGCCTVHLNSDAVKSCVILAVQADGASVTTIEGLKKGDALHPVQTAFQEHHALQCGYCTAGIVMNAVDILRKHSDLDENRVRHLLEGNICRCTGYVGIVDAILDVAAQKSELD